MYSSTGIAKHCGHGGRRRGRAQHKIYFFQVEIASFAAHAEQIDSLIIHMLLLNTHSQYI